MQIGDKIKTIYGNLETIMNVEEARITTFESFCNNSWYHPTKVFPVYWNEMPGADPLAGWCGEGERKTPTYPISDPIPNIF